MVSLSPSFGLSFARLDPKEKPVEAPPKGEDEADGLPPPKLILPEPKEKAPPWDTPLVLAKLEPMAGVFAGVDVSWLALLWLSFASALLLLPPKLNRKAELEAGFRAGDEREGADPNEKGVLENMDGADGVAEKANGVADEPPGR